MKEEEKKVSGTSRIFQDFSGWTSAHGIPHIFATHSKALTVFWCIVFFASCGMFAYQLGELIKKYLTYDVSVQTELKFENRVFPAVTICNMNPYIRSRINASAEMVNLMGTYKQYLEKRKVDLFDKNNEWGIKSANDDTMVAQDIAQTHLWFIGRNLNASVQEKLTYRLTATSGASVHDYDSELVLECTYNNEPCNIALTADPTGQNPVDEDGDFKKLYDPQYGNCYTFNFDKGNGKVPYMSTRAGPQYGVRLLAITNQAQYLPLTEAAGMRVAVHSQKEYPFPDAFGYNAAAGFTTSFGIKYVKTIRLPKPHGQCIDSTAEGSSYFYDGEYSVEGCFRSCSQTTILEFCGCGDPRFNLPPGDFHYCQTKNTTARECVKSFATGGNKTIIEERCWCDQNCAENTILIEAYYERMNYKQLQETPAYTVVNLISDMGGQLGLWLGISVITMIELIALLIMCCVYCITRPDLSKLDEWENESDDDY